MTNDEKELQELLRKAPYKKKVSKGQLRLRFFHIDIATVIYNKLNNKLKKKYKGLGVFKYKQLEVNEDFFVKVRVKNL